MTSLLQVKTMARLLGSHSQSPTPTCLFLVLNSAVSHINSLINFWKKTKHYFFPFFCLLSYLFVQIDWIWMFTYGSGTGTGKPKCESKEQNWDRFGHTGPFKTYETIQQYDNLSKITRMLCWVNLLTSGGVKIFEIRVG